MSQITEAYFPSARTQDEVIHRSVLKPESTDNKGIAVMDMVIFRTIFFELLVFFTFTLLIFHFAY